MDTQVAAKDHRKARTPPQCPAIVHGIQARAVDEARENAAVFARASWHERCNASRAQSLVT